MAGIDIAEKRLPQDGRIKLKVDKSDIDFRVVRSLPITANRSCFVFFAPDSVRIGITKYGFRGRETTKHFQKIIKQSQRHLPGHGPDRFGQNHYALRGT